MNANTQTSFTGLEGKLRSPLKSKLLPRLTLCVCKKKKKKTFYFKSEDQRGYLTDFPFVLLIVLMKPKKPKIFFCPFSAGSALRSTLARAPPSVTAMRFVSSSALRPMVGQTVAPQTATAYETNSWLGAEHSRQRWFAVLCFSYLSALIIAK